MRTSVFKRIRVNRPVAAAVAMVAAIAVVTVPATVSEAGTTGTELINTSTGERADVMWAATDKYQGVFLWPDNRSASQEFDLLDSGNGYFRLRVRHSKQCLMLDNRSGSYGNGTPVVQYPACGPGYAPSEWRRSWLSGTTCSGGVCTTGTDRMLLVNRQTRLCLDARNPPGVRPPVRAVLQQWACAPSAKSWNIDNQAWDLRRSGAVRID